MWGVGQSGMTRFPRTRQCGLHASKTGGGMRDDSKYGPRGGAWTRCVSNGALLQTQPTATMRAYAAYRSLPGWKHSEKIEGNPRGAASRFWGESTGRRQQAAHSSGQLNRRNHGRCDLQAGVIDY